MDDQSTNGENTSKKVDRLLQSASNASAVDERMAQMRNKAAEEEQRFKRFVLILIAFLAVLMLIIFACFYFFGGKPDENVPYPLP